MKKNLAVPELIASAILIAIIAFFISGCANTGAKTGKGNANPAEQEKKDATKTLNQYYSEIDYSCSTDTDCEIKNIGNCCGQYLQCVNRNARTDPDLVRKLCEKEGAASICGFKSISSCACINKRCEGRK